MKKLYLSTLILASVSSFSAFAASDNTITFQGEVTDQTCTLTVNGEAASPIILLPTVSTSDFTSNVAGSTPFDVGVTGCTANAASISTVFVGNNVTSQGNLGNTGSATDVGIQILKPDATTAIDFTNTFTGNADLKLADDATSATSTYYAQYYNAGSSTAATGTVTASLQYSVSYQ